jgi:hypothetical protein
MTIRNHESMTAESESNAKDAAKELRMLGFPADIRSLSINLSIVLPTFSVFGTQLLHARASSGTGQLA